MCVGGHMNGAPCHYLNPWQTELDSLRASGCPYVLLDVRPPLQYALMSLPGAINIPTEQLNSRLGEVHAALEAAAATAATAAATAGSDQGAGAAPLFVVCRRGNQSQVCARFCLLPACQLAH